MKYPFIAALIFLLAGCGASSGSFSTSLGDSTVSPLPGANPVPGTPAPGQAVADSYLSLGNVLLDVPASEGVLSNDGTGSALASTELSSSRGGRVSLRSDGSFVYSPPLGLVDDDTFRYQLTNGSTAEVKVELGRRVVFVQQGAASPGTGHQEDPFPSLTSALAVSVPEDLLYLLDGPSPLLFSGALPDGRRLWGQGVPLQTDRVLLRAAGFSRLQGELSLGNRNELRGIQFQNPSGNTITATARQEGTIRDNRFTLVARNAIALTDCQGLFDVSSNTFLDEETLDPREGLLLTLTGSTALDLVFRDNRFTTPDRTTAFDHALRLLANGVSQLSLTVEGNAVEVQGSGLSLQLADGSRLEARVEGNEFNRCQLGGIALVAGTADSDLASSRLVVERNSFTAMPGPAVTLRAQGRNSVEQDWLVSGNSITAGGNFGIQVVRNAAAVVRATVTENVISNAAQAAIQVTSGSPSGGFSQPLNGQDRLSITNNRMSGGGTAGIALSLVSQTQASLLTGNISSSPFSILARAGTSHLALGSNEVTGALRVTVEPGFTLRYHDQGQISPTPTFQGGGTVTPAPFEP